MLNSTFRSRCPSLGLALAAIVCTATVTASAADLNITHAVTYNGQTATMQLTRQNLRGPNFEVVQQESDGSFTPVTVTSERAYLGTVDEFPDAVASGILTEAGVFRGLIIFDRGNTWYVQGSTVHRTLGFTTPPVYKYPTLQATPGQVGTATTHLEIAYDYTSAAYTNLGATTAKALEEAEYDMALQRGLYMTNILVRPYLARVIIRTSGTSDPYVGLTTGQFLDAVKTEWQTNQSTEPRNLVAGIGANIFGLAGGTGFGFDGGYFVQPWGANGNTWGFIRHEMGHCFGMGHEDGGGPEGATINSHGNIYARMSTSEIKKAFDRRDSRASEMTTEGTYTGVDLPPYACMDAVEYSYASQSTVLVDVLGNDHDANNDTFSIQSFDVTSQLGAAVTLSVGTGPGGRNQLALQRLADHGQEDWFTYRVQDSSGQTATGVVYSRGERPSAQLTGTLIGSTGSWGGNSAWTKDKAMDGNLSTFYAADSPSGDWVGLDLGAGNTKAITKIRFAARSGFESRMNGGIFQASNSDSFSSGVVTLHTISGSPASGSLTNQLINNNDVYRYVRYFGPANGECNVAEIEFWGAEPAAPNPPNGVTASGAGSAQVNLSWYPSTFATSYKVKRSTSSGGPYSTVGSPAATSFIDSTVVSGTTYYYVVSAVNGSGEGADSAQVSALPAAVISIDCQGSGTAMASGEVAGIVEVDNWNNAAGASGSLASLSDDSGAATGASAGWSSNNTWGLSIADSTGNNRMMKGYLDTSATSTTTVSVSGLPSTYTAAGYDVYVYCDGDNGSGNKTGRYTIGTTTITATDNGGTNFGGTFVQGNGSAGNYVIFANQTSSSFTLSAVGTPTDPAARAAVNGIQIVARGSAVPPPSTPTFVAAGAIAAGTGTIAPALPSGLATGDILLLFVETANQTVSVSGANGGTWAQVTGSPQGTGTAAGSTATRLTAFWSRYNGAQGAPTLSDSGNHQVARMIAIRGAAASGTPWDVTAGGVETTSDTSASIPGATTTVANTLVVIAASGNLPDGTGTSNFSGWSNANLSGLTERTDNTSNAGNGGALGIATGGKATAGAYGNTAVTHGSSAIKGMISIAIKN